MRSSALYLVLSALYLVLSALYLVLSALPSQNGQKKGF